MLRPGKPRPKPVFGLKVSLEPITQDGYHFWRATVTYNHKIYACTYQDKELAFDQVTRQVKEQIAWDAEEKEVREI